MRKEAALEQQRRNALANRVLTDDETSLVVITRREMLVMGLGLDKNSCQIVVSCILAERIAENFLFR